MGEATLHLVVQATDLTRPVLQRVHVTTEEDCQAVEQAVRRIVGFNC